MRDLFDWWRFKAEEIRDYNCQTTFNKEYNHADYLGRDNPALNAVGFTEITGNYGYQ
jgi:hypothetical protein